MSEVWLGLDTCTPHLCIAIWSPSRGLLDARVEQVDRKHAARMVPALDEALARAGVARQALTAVAVGRGPGSYTGLRVGGAAAKGLSRALGIPLAGCDTLAAIAYGALADGEEGLAALDARRGNLYLGRYRREGDEVVTVRTPYKVALREVLEEHTDLRLIQDAAPDPAYIARQAGNRAVYRPLYL